MKQQKYKNKNAEAEGKYNARKKEFADQRAARNDNNRKMYIKKKNMELCGTVNVVKKHEQN